MAFPSSPHFLSIFLSSGSQEPLTMCSFFFLLGAPKGIHAQEKEKRTHCGSLPDDE